MALRVVCPSCSTALSVKDEYAGRSVKCPKCGATIPPPAPAAPEPAATEANAVAPEPPPAEPVAPVAPPTARPTARPVARSAGEDEDRPVRRRDRDEDDRDDRPRRGPPRRRDREPERAPSGGRTVAIVLGIVGFFLLVFCGGVGYGVYWLYNRAKETVQEVRDNFEKANSRVTYANYTKLQTGTTTRSQAEAILGTGKIATDADVALAFPGGAYPDRVAIWAEKVAQGRAVFWRNGDDFLLLAFHPKAEADSRIQLKEWRPANLANAREGEPDDALFPISYPPPKKTDPLGPGGAKDEEPPPGAIPDVTAVELAQEFRDNEAAANGKYKDQWWIVEGKVLDVRPAPDPNTKADTVAIDLVGVKFPGGKQDFPVRCSIRAAEARGGLNLTRGQTVKLKGKCTRGGLLDTYVTLRHCRIDFTGPDPAVVVTAAAMMADYIKDSEAADQKYRDKEVLLTNARFESASGDVAQFQMTPKKGGTPIRIQVRFSFDQFEKLRQLKRGAVVQFKTRCGGLFGDHIAGYDAYLVP